MCNNLHIKCAMLMFFVVAFFLVTPPSRSDVMVDHSIYADLLARYVNNGRVDYQGFKNEEQKLDQYLELLANVAVKKLVRNEQFAFYINAYNAWTIKLILSGYPGVTSIKDLGTIFKSPWKKRICRIGDDVFTLDEIEHKILRPKFNDPRVHFAINCAAFSCPPLLSQPYLGSILDRQLDDVTKAFINDAKSNYLSDKKLYVSKIFKWFSEDFNNDILGFFIQYAAGDFRETLASNRNRIEIKYLPYDWSLNGK